MSQQIGGYPPATGAGTPTGQPTTQVARDEAGEVGRTAADAGKQVAGTAAEQAANVAQEAKAQARDLVGEARGQVGDQARMGQQKATDGIRTLGRELREMADGGQQSGTASEVARQAADRADRFADWLGQREPGELVEEVRTFARRRPGAFLLGAALAGVVVGRLTRGAVDSARADSGPAVPRAYGPTGSQTTGYETTGYQTTDHGTAGCGTAGYGTTGYPGALPLPYDSPIGTAPVGSPVGTGLDAPVAPRPSASPSVDLGTDPYDPPAPPRGTHAPRPGSTTVSEYVEEIGRTAGERRETGPDTRLDDPLDDPYRPGRGDSR